MSKKEFVCPTPCGFCCIVTTHVQLSKAEVKSGLYETIKAKDEHRPKKPDGYWSGRILKQVRRYVPEARKRLFVCVYLDMKTRRCKIYEQRPFACKAFNCKEDKKYEGERQWMFSNKANFANLYTS